MNQKVLVSGVATVMCAVMVMESSAQAAQPDKEFTIAVGEVLQFDARGIREVFVGIPSIVGAGSSDDGRSMELTGLKEGSTMVTISSNREEMLLLVRVVPVNPEILADEVRTILGKRSGVSVRVVNGRVLIEGAVASKTYQDRIDQMVALYPNQLLNFASYRESFVDGAKMVALEIDFVQLAVTDRDNLGVKWGQFVGANYTFGNGDVPLFYGSSPAIGEGILPGEVNPARLPRAATLTGGTGLSSYFSMVGNLNVALDFMVDHGMIKTRQHGVLVTEAGTVGEYQAGGTILIRVSNQNIASVERIPYGLKVKAKPIVDDSNRVKVELEVAFEEIDNANGVDGIPALRTAKMKGVVNMQEGQSVLISGLTSSQETSGEQGWWLLSKIPILGWAFKSRTFVGQQLDNALFITPRLYMPGGQVHRTLVDGVFKEMLDEGFDAEELPKLSEAPTTSSTSSSSSTPSSSSGGEGAEGGEDGLDFE